MMKFSKLGKYYKTVTGAIDDSTEDMRSITGCNKISFKHNTFRKHIRDLISGSSKL